MGKSILRWVLLLVALVLVAFAVTSPVPVAGAEESRPVVEGLQDIPVYVPVTLAAQEVTPIAYSERAPYEPHASAYLDDSAGYLDDTLSIKIDHYRAYNTDMLITWVQVADPSQLRTALNARWPSESTTKAVNLSKREKAVLAINGDYIVHMNTGYAARNGVILRERYNDKAAANFDSLMVDANGDFTVIQGLSGDKVKAYLAEHEIVHAFTFGPALVVDGVKNEYYPVKEHVATHRTQRQGIGQIGENTYVIVTTDGPDDKESTGLMLTEFANIFLALGAKNAYNLDGGSSSWLLLNNTRLNGMHGSKHRTIADIIYFVTACPEEVTVQ